MESLRDKRTLRVELSHEVWGLSVEGANFNSMELLEALRNDMR